MDEAVKKLKLEELLTTAQEKGYKIGWAAYAFKDEFGEWPPKDWMPEPSADEIAHRKARKTCFFALKHMELGRSYKEGWAKHQFKAAFSKDAPEEWETEAVQHVG